MPPLVVTGTDSGSTSGAPGRAGGWASLSPGHSLRMVGWFNAQRARYMAENAPNPPILGVSRSLERCGACGSFDRAGADMVVFLCLVNRESAYLLE